MFKHVSTIQDIYCSHPLSCEVHIRNVLYIGNSSWMSLKMFISSESGRLEKQRTVASGMEYSKPPEMSLLAKCGTADLVWESRYRSRLAIHVSMRWAICTNAKSLGHYIYSYFATEAASKSYGIGQNLTYNPYLLFVRVRANYGKSLCGICIIS